ncbi:hypothetical protein GCM10027435_15220 [Haloparvum alkalitolerans]|uniref:hypothetical protein n=1 Tax=Haloparvum alkalitolerans TaxID=1042953 RepID=UPI003CF345A4
MTTLLNGLLGGFAAGIVATIAVRAVVARTVTSRAGVSVEGPRSIPLGVAYGALAGLGFVAGELYVAGALGVPPSFGEALAAAAVWSALLCLGLLAIGRLLRSGGADGGVDGGVPVVPPARLLVAYHLAFAVGLGVWIRLTWIT